jgi:hypothetical protein
MSMSGRNSIENLVVPDFLSSKCELFMEGDSVVYQFSKAPTPEELVLFSKNSLDTLIKIWNKVIKTDFSSTARLNCVWDFSSVTEAITVNLKDYKLSTSFNFMCTNPLLGKFVIIQPRTSNFVVTLKQSDILLQQSAIKKVKVAKNLIEAEKILNSEINGIQMIRMGIEP